MLNDTPSSMNPSPAQRNWPGLTRLLPPLSVAIVAAAMFFSGIGWGLPSRTSDAYLFGSRTPWTGKQILALAGDWDEAADRGADIAMHPLTGRDQPIVVNATDAQRAAIVRRFRLYSDQPDEMITFRALSRMKPGAGDLDPHFFQYGGLWVYPVAALLKLASVVHVVTLRGDLAFYLDHPEAFGRFYIVARAYSAAWGIVGALVVYALMMEWTAKRFAAVVASLLFCAMPVVVNAAHEAKPHLAGGVLVLATVLLAMRFVRTGKSRWSVAAGACAGAAGGMILTGVVAFVVLPVMVMLRPMAWRRRVGIMVVAGAVGVGVFLASNPYLPIDYLFHREIVRSNVGNYGNFYAPRLSGETLSNAVELVATGISLTLTVLCVLLAARAILRRFRPKPVAAWPHLVWLPIAPMALQAAQFVLLASDKPAEYARFALLLDVVLAMACAAAIASLSANWRVIVSLLVLCGAFFEGSQYIASCRADSSANSSRVQGAQVLADLCKDDEALRVTAEPAPYCLPPVDLFRWRIVLLPREAELASANGCSVVPTDYWNISGSNLMWNKDPFAYLSPISWADKPFDIRQYDEPASRP